MAKLYIKKKINKHPINTLMKFFVVLFSLALLLSCNTTVETKVKPNIIYFLADDLGYGEVGVYGQTTIQTPNIDALASNGMLFTQHYSGAPVCAPARYMLLTGLHSGHAYIRGNDEWAERGDVWNYELASNNPEYEGQRPIPETTVTVAHKLKDAGYTTGIFGKWGLGAPNTEGVPNNQGFDQFFGYNCQRQAHNLYPPHLWKNDQKIKLNNELVAPRTGLDSLADPNLDESYVKYNQKDYAPTVIHNEALAFIEQNKENPFFMYYASPLPHLPLQAPQEFIADYKQSLGSEEPYLGERGYFPNRTPRATYAAMISYLDKQLGDLVALLKELDIYENTLIIFTSDNGPTYTGGVDFEFFESSKPFQNGYGRTKGYLYEGGIRVPMIASWPNQIKPGTQSDLISSFYDIMPTLCDIADVKPPEHIDGLSFTNELLGQKQNTHEYLYWEFPSYKGQQAVRMGKWKGIRKNIFDGNLAVELYDLDKDIAETTNIADAHPEIVKQIEEIMIKEHIPSDNERFKFKELGDN